jgi:mono/diheme cytochrome c family protein
MKMQGPTPIQFGRVLNGYLGIDRNPRRLSLSAFVLLLAFSILAGCDAPKRVSPEELLRNEFCKPLSSERSFDETPYIGSSAVVHSFQNIRASVNSACASCHMVPAQNGGFTYTDSWQGAELSVNGVVKYYPGLSEVAEKLREAILATDPQKQMPPVDRRSKNPQAFLDIGHQLEIWIAAGKPNGTFEAGSVPEVARGKARPMKPRTTSDLGDCVPTEKAIGSDYKKDRFFETAKALPKYLTETDLTTLDPYELAQQGTVAYNVEYPLWTDNAEKGRWVHVPMKIESGELRRQSIGYDAQTQQFKIPENTRFYKTFYRAITLPNKRVKMRRMETRIIVARTPWQNSLFGTYQWDETEQVATLVETPYRDGTPWKDLVFDVTVDETKGKVRPYAIPGRQRCIDCHTGSPTQNFVLGFQPLQINRRPLGGAGRTVAPEPSDLDQVARLTSYHVLAGLPSGAELPLLETSGRLPARNIHELRASGYMVGNCYHCHNPSGIAMSAENGVRLALGPGDVFQFNTQQKSIQIPSRRLVHQNGELDGSHIWRKVADTSAQLGMFSQMPMHTVGGPDCNVLRVMGKWIRSFESEQAADEWEPECKKENPFTWIDMDFTYVKSDVYTPVRAEWADPAYGMPEKYRRFEPSPELLAAVQKEYAVGYWLKKPQCRFPDVQLPPEAQRPWMMRGSVPKRPFGEVYTTTPGAYMYRNTCLKCHGTIANGDSALARGILNWSGGSARVANLIDGLFGKKNENLKTFDLGGHNYAGQYLIWMAMEGTRVRFPPEVASFMGKHGAQMLNGIREKCIAQISTDKPSSPQFVDHELFNQICFLNNLQPGHPDLKYDSSTNKPLYPEKVEEWADRAAWNAGWSIFEFLKEGSVGNWRLNNDQCEVKYGPAVTNGGPSASH